MEIYKVIYAGNIVCFVNPCLIEQQSVMANLKAIKHCHWLKHVIYDLMSDTDNPSELYSLGQDLTEIEYELQRLWGFPQDPAFHRSWEYPKCVCPVLDNIERYPHEKVLNGRCPVHNEY